MASYLTTMFDPNLAYKLMQMDHDNFPPPQLDKDLNTLLNTNPTQNLPELMRSVSIK